MIISKAPLRISFFGGSTDYVTDVVLLHYNDFKDFKIDYWTDKEERKKFDFREIGVYAESLEELISNGEALNLKFLISNEQETFYYPFVDQIYHNEKNYLKNFIKVCQNFSILNSRIC